MRNGDEPGWSAPFRYWRPWRGLVFIFLFFSYSLHSVSCLIGFRCVAYWPHNHILSRVSTRDSQRPPGTVQSTAVLLTVSLCRASHPCACSVAASPCNPFPSSTQAPAPSPGHHQSTVCGYQSVSILFAPFLCSLDPTCEWNHRASAVVCPTWFSEHVEVLSSRVT